MGFDPALFREYKRAMDEHGGSVVAINATVYQLSCIVSILQIGIARNPHGPGTPTAKMASDFLESVLEKLHRAHPALAEVARAARGN